MIACAEGLYLRHRHQRLESSELHSNNGVHHPAVAATTDLSIHPVQEVTIQ